MAIDEAGSWWPLPLDARRCRRERRFFVALLWGTGVLIARGLRWSNWWRHHQALAEFFHYSRFHNY